MKWLLCAVLAGLALYVGLAPSVSADGEPWIRYASGSVRGAGGSVEIPDYNQAVHNRASVTVYDPVFGCSTGSVNLNGSTVCSGAGGCSYEWDATEGVSADLEFVGADCHGHDVSYWVGGYRPTVRGVSVYAPPMHWSHIPQFIAPGVSAQGVWGWVGDLLNPSGALGGSVTWFIAAALLMMIFSAVRHILHGLARPDSKNPTAPEGRGGIYDEKGAD